MQTIRMIKSTFYFLLYGAIILFAFFALSAKFSLPGQWRLLAVLSGSMEPTIKTGSLIFVKPINWYQPNDIITFHNPYNPHEIITHRLIKIEKSDGRAYGVTKGDANNAPDRERVYFDNVIGKLNFSIPYLGYPLAFMRTWLGLIIFIIIPGTIIVYDEILNIKKEISKKKRPTKGTIFIGPTSSNDYIFIDLKNLQKNQNHTPKDPSLLKADWVSTY